MIVRLAVCALHTLLCNTPAGIQTGCMHVAASKSHTCNEASMPASPAGRASNLKPTSQHLQLVTTYHAVTAQLRIGLHTSALVDLEQHYRATGSTEQAPVTITLNVS
jgi:hypothetical protein